MDLEHMRGPLMVSDVALFDWRMGFYLVNWSSDMALALDFYMDARGLHLNVRLVHKHKSTLEWIPTICACGKATASELMNHFKNNENFNFFTSIFGVVKILQNHFVESKSIIFIPTIRFTVWVWIAISVLILGLKHDVWNSQKNVSFNDKIGGFGEFLITWNLGVKHCYQTFWVIFKQHAMMKLLFAVCFADHKRRFNKLVFWFTISLNCSPCQLIIFQLIDISFQHLFALIINHWFLNSHLFFYSTQRLWHFFRFQLFS